MTTSRAGSATADARHRLTPTQAPERRAPAPIRAGVGELGRRFARLLEEAGHGAHEVCGMGLAVPGP
ncbi:sugar kinase, partial [Streptomyces sp. NPDC004012]